MTFKLHAFVPTLVFACSVITSLLGCGDDSPSPDAGNDAAVTCDLASKPGDTVFLACASSYDLVVAGDGFRAPAPKGSTCDGGETYHLNADKRTLDWTRCDATNDITTPWTQSHGSRPLSASELSTATSALKKVVVVTSKQCGADKPTITLKVTTPDTSKTYTDSFYSCDQTRAPFVDNIDDAHAALSTLAKGDVSCPERPVCATGSQKFQSEADCNARADSCKSIVVCSSTIWCGTNTSDGGETDDASSSGDAG